MMMTKKTLNKTETRIITSQVYKERTFIPRFATSSRANWLLSCDAAAAEGNARCVGGAPLGYQAHPLAWLLKILNLSYTESLFCTDACCSFCDARLRKTRLIDETYSGMNALLIITYYYLNFFICYRWAQKSFL